MAAYESLKRGLQTDQHIWIISGVAGFIVSNLLESFLKLDHRVVGLDNFSTKYQRNLDQVQNYVTHEQRANFSFIQGDIRNLDDCRRGCEAVNHVLSQAVLGSVPRSVENPVAANQNNIDGFLNMLVAASDTQVNRFVFAASSFTYGGHPDLPEIANKIGKPSLPCAASKLANEPYADVFTRTYGFRAVDIRYFNIFGHRQSPSKAYATVVAKWIVSLIDRTSLYQLYIYLRDKLAQQLPYLSNAKPVYIDFRVDDVRHSLS